MSGAPRSPNARLKPNTDPKTDPNIGLEMTADARAALNRSGFSRRDFLKQSGALIVGFSVVGLGSELGTVHGQVFQGASAGSPPLNQVDSWIAIGADGSVTAYTGKGKNSARASSLRRLNWLPKSFAFRSTA